MGLNARLKPVETAAKQLRQRLRTAELYSLGKASNSRVYRYGLTLVVCCLFLAFRISLGHRLDGAPYIVLIAAVLVCALFGGLAAGLAATAVNVISYIYFLDPDLYRSDVAGVLAFVVVAIILNFLLWGRRTAKEVARDSEEQFRSAFNQAAVGMSYTAIDGRWLQVNAKYAELTGYSLEELNHKDFRELTHPDDLKASEEIMERLLQGEANSLTLLKRYIKKNGSQFWADMTVSLVRDNGQPKYFVAVIQDVTEKKEAEEQLRASEELYRTMIETAEEGVWILDANDKTKFVNNKMTQMMGYAGGEIIGRSPVDFVDEEGRQVLKSHLEMRHRGISEQYDLKWRRKDGSELWTSVSTTPMRTPEGEYDGALAMISDISRRKDYEREIESQHQRIYSLFASAPALIAVLRGPEHVFEFANRKYVETVGVNHDFIGLPVRQALPELEGQGFYELLDKVYTTGKAFIGEEMLVKLDHGRGLEEHYFNFVYQVAKGPAGETDGIFVHAVEVTDQVKTRVALEKNRERLQLAQEAGNIGTFEWNIKTNQVVWSARLEVLYGLSPGGFGGKIEDWMELVHPEDRLRLRQQIDDAVAKRQELDVEFRIACKNGEVKWISARGQVHYDQHSQPERMIGINRNISKRKQAERGLRFLTKASSVLASSLNYETTLKSVANLAVGELADWCTIDMLDDDGKIERIAQACSQRIEPDKAEVLKQSRKSNQQAKTGVLEVLHTGKPVFYSQLSPEDLQNLSQSPERSEIIAQLGFSSVIIVPIQILGWAAGAITLATIGDQHYNQADLALAESLSERASAAIDNAWLYKETQIAREELEERVRQRTAELSGKNEELNEAQRISHLGSWEWDVTNDKRQWSEEMYRIYGLEADDFEPTTESIMKFTHPDDVERTGEEVKSALTAEGGLFTSEYRIKRLDGTIRNLFAQGRVVKDQSGQPVKMVGTVLDITDRKKVEQMKSDFVSLVSHQLKTPLAIIKGYTDNILLGIAGDLTDKQRQYLREMQEITTKYYYLIADLLNVSRIERGVISVDARPVDLNEVAQAALEGHKDRILAKGLKLMFERSREPVIIMADNAKTAEAISNVIDNAIKFTDQGRIEVSIKTNGKYGVIEIADSGRGMNQEVLGKLFKKDQVFSGSPSAEGGSGLGLYIAKEFCRVQGGEASAESKLGKGSKFTFRLPLAKVEAGVMQNGR